MKLTPHEIDKLKLHQTGFVAQKRLAVGTRLNIPESTALLVTQVMELARSGDYTVAELMDIGRTILGRNQVVSGVAHVLDEVQIEATFQDGTKLVTLHSPISAQNGDLKLALLGTNLKVPDVSAFLVPADEEKVTPGLVNALPGHIELNQGRSMIVIVVENTCDRPIQVGSHYHFIEANPKLVRSWLL